VYNLYIKVLEKKFIDKQMISSEKIIKIYSENKENYGEGNFWKKLK
jgi:hypothetical protein